MKVLYDVGISHVDGETYYHCTGEKEVVRNFLLTYDHEGAVTELDRVEWDPETGRKVKDEIGLDDIAKELGI